MLKVTKRDQYFPELTLQITQMLNKINTQQFLPKHLHNTNLNVRVQSGSLGHLVIL